LLFNKEISPSNIFRSKIKFLTSEETGELVGDSPPTKSN
jgi:hypothetical protein